MNILAISINLSEYKTILTVKIAESIFSCEISRITDVCNTAFEINDRDLIRLRNFLNELINENEST